MRWLAVTKSGRSERYAVRYSGQSSSRRRPLGRGRGPERGRSSTRKNTTEKNVKCAK